MDEKVINMLAELDFSESQYDGKFSDWSQATIDATDQRGHQIFAELQKNTNGHIALRPLAMPKNNWHVLVHPFVMEAVEFRQAEMLANVNGFVEMALGAEVGNAYGETDKGIQSIIIDLSPKVRTALIAELKGYGCTFQSVEEIELWLAKVGFEPTHGDIRTLWQRPVAAV